MSLDYESLFSEIDKAKLPKKGKLGQKWDKKIIEEDKPKKKRWNQADTDKWAKQQKEEKEKKPRVSQPKYTDGKESDSRGRTFESLGEYSTGGVAGENKRRHASSDKKPKNDKRIKPADPRYSERKQTKEQDKGSVRIGDLPEGGSYGEENPNTKNLPKYSKQEERSGMSGKPHKERKKPDTTDRLDAEQKKLNERKILLQDLKDLKDELERKQSGVAGETIEEGKEKDKEWGDKKLIEDREQTRKRKPHPKKRRTSDYGTVSGGEKLGEEPSGMFGSKGHPRKKPKTEIEAQYKKIRAKLEAMDKDPYVQAVSEAGGKKIGIDAAQRKEGDKEIKVDPRINEPTPKKGFIGPSLAMTEDEKELARKKFPNPAFAHPEHKVLTHPKAGRDQKLDDIKETQRKIIAARGGGPPESKEDKIPREAKVGISQTVRPWNKPQSKRITDPYDYREAAEDTLRGTAAEKPKKPANPNNPKGIKMRKAPKKRKTPKYMMDEDFNVAAYKPGQDKDDDDELESEYDGTVGKALWTLWLEKKTDECPNCGKKRMGKKTKLLWNFITQPPDIYPSEIDGSGDDEEEDEDTKKALWKAWLKIKAEEGIGGMNMGAQRGLGHDAGYKQDPGQSAQITEVKDEDEESKKSAYEVYEQNETPETEPTKRQIPHSKPKMDTFKSLYKKALIVKYKNIYKPLNT